MKVLVQDLGSMRFLAVNGNWVEDKDDAQDFFSLLPAYNFARDNTSSQFQILLYCPEDNFCASIIAGIGTAARIKASVAGNRKKQSAGLSRVNGVYLPDNFDELRWNLN